MSCNNTNRNCSQKSCQRYYNNATQTLAAGSNLQIAIAGTKVVDTGVSIDTEPGSFNTTKPGLYHISGDIVIESSAAGDVDFQVYMDGIGMPCTLKTVTIPATGSTAIHTETDVRITGCCCNVNHTFTFNLSSALAAAGSVTEACFGIIKEA